MQLTIAQVMALLHAELQTWPVTMVRNSALKWLVKLDAQLQNSGQYNKGLVDFTERVEPSQDFGTSSPKQSEPVAEKSAVEDAPEARAPRPRTQRGKRYTPRSTRPSEEEED